MDNERASVINIGGREHELLLTTKATKEIAKKFGGLKNLGESLAGTEHFEEALDDLVWLLVLLANQSIYIHNFRHASDPLPFLTAEEVELLTVPGDLADYKDAIMNALIKGTKREIVSEPKNG